VQAKKAQFITTFGGLMSVTSVDHPLIKHHLARLRNVLTPPNEFRGLAHCLAGLLAYEATKDLAVESTTVETPLAVAPGGRISQRIGLVPILRAGLSMVDPVLQLIPSAEVWHLGLYRDEETAQPVEYYSKLPAARPVDVALILDPMLATGGSAVSAMAALRRWGVHQLKLLSIIAAPEGVREVQNRFPDSQIFVAAIDQRLNDRKFIVPGLGDAGDRLFNTLPQ
jgi:uracil phosphoribosyltransferase